MDEAMIENFPWESDEAEYWESDEAIAEADESAEDIGERARRRRRYRSRSQPRRPFQPARGVQGIAVRGQNGKVSNLPFPKRLATAAETNRGLANQEMARRELADRVNDLEARRRKDLKNAGQATGLVSLVMIGGLAGYGAIQAIKQTEGSKFEHWVKQPSTQMATVASATQLVGSGASYIFTGGYHGGAVRIAADAVSAVQILAYAFGSFYTQTPTTRHAGYRIVDTYEQADAAKATDLMGTYYHISKTHDTYRLELDPNGARVLWPISEPGIGPGIM